MGRDTESSRVENPTLASGAVQFHPLGLKPLAAESAPTTATLKRVGRTAKVTVAEEVA
ncbi:MAG: hypothetical protein HY716_05595 [Planctomycetes bacterium]|nr:hypothetical protein [Planctomycetota bacterium]